MDRLSIDRLILDVPGLSESDGRRLVRKVADGLGAARFAGEGLEIPSLRLDLRPRPGEGVDDLAGRIVAEFARQVRRIP